MQARTPPRPVVASACAAIVVASVAPAQSPFLRTYLGGGGYERVQGVAVDALGRIYVAGHATTGGLSAALPAQAGGHDTTWNGGLDGFVVLLSADLGEVLRWTWIGGSGEDRAYQVEVDPSGRVVVVGLSGSADLPVTSGAANHGSWDAFVARFSSDLADLVACTSLGGSAEENPRGSVALDGAGNVYLGGSSASLDFPTTPGAFQGTHAAVAPDPRDAFVAKLDVAGNVLWATLLGGGRNDAAYSGCRVAANGDVVVAGMTNSSDFPTTAGAFQPDFGGHVPDTGPHAGDGFVARLSADGSRLEFSTYLGGSGADFVAGNDALELDPSGAVVVIGGTRSSDFPATAGAYDTSFAGTASGAPDAFVARLSADGSQLLASSFLGGERSEEPSGLAIGPGGEVVLSGNTESSDFPVTPDASQASAPGGLCDAFLVKLSHDLRRLAYSSYLGGQGTSGHGDRGRGLVLLPSLDVVLGGDTDSVDLPVSAGAFDPSYNGGAGDGFVEIGFLSRSYSFGAGKITSAGTLPVLTLHGIPSCTGGSATFTLGGALPHAHGCIAASGGLVSTPAWGGTWYLAPPAARAGRVQLDASGAATWTCAVLPPMVGETRVHQGWFRDPSHPDGTGAGLTNAVKVTFVP